ncbi:uncharacterized protein BDZ83DRAFT_647771 [Colletotrichum acutatum]|uniref:Uncharacterized protein n=1 Tax=Glomerella acutata TaxID=27357 RepID=A0AAD8XL99_GLOAC|nr:uncharacterized protein BDZ83DRAFT_647771 [Colletotrichum acutatum]KAK1729466.1 hypothetical protein BDZ83DRAFT_647771 [Colletotrichum acutatum]
MTEPASAQRPFLPNSFVPSLMRVAVILASDHRRVSDDDSLDLLLHHSRESALFTTDLEHPTRAISLLLWVFTARSLRLMLYSRLGCAHGSVELAFNISWMTPSLRYGCVPTCRFLVLALGSRRYTPARYTPARYIQHVVASPTFAVFANDRQCSVAVMLGMGWKCVHRNVAMYAPFSPTPVYEDSQSSARHIFEPKRVIYPHTRLLAAIAALIANVDLTSRQDIGWSGFNDVSFAVRVYTALFPVFRRPRSANRKSIRVEYYVGTTTPQKWRRLICPGRKSC